MSDIETPAVEADVDVVVENVEEVIELPRLTVEQIEANRRALEDAIEVAVQQFAFGQDEEQFNSMNPKEQTYTKLLDPLVWIMRESLVTYEHEDCEECRERRETDANNLGVAVAEMILGRL
jgi:hypothetical protein